MQLKDSSGGNHVQYGNTGIKCGGSGTNCPCSRRFVCNSGAESQEQEGRKNSDSRAGTVLRKFNVDELARNGLVVASREGHPAFSRGCLLL